MDNLRALSVSVVDSTTIKVKFSHELDPAISASNIKIVADLDKVPNPEVLKVSISGADMKIKTQPMTQLFAYYLIFASTDTVKFKSKNGDAIVANDGVSDRQVIIGPPDPTNPVYDYLKNYLRDNVYNLDDDTTLVSKIVHVFSIVLAKSLYDIRQVKNENYLSFQVNDEEHTRTSGPFDRLDEEAAYKIIRVGLTPTGSSAEQKFLYSNFPSYPITLQKVDNVEILTIDSKNTTGKFNINELILNLSKTYVVKLDKLTFTLSGANPVYEYDISKYGYQILDSRYDTEFGFDYLTLENNQIKLNNLILSDPNFSLTEVISVRAEYSFKNKGIIVDSSVLEVSNILTSVRETLPPIINSFALSYAPVVDSNGNVSSLGGVIFRDANVLTSSQKHPAFITEIPFSFNSMPARAGEYSIDYSTGTVYVYGADSNNDGTGAYPPLATYKYKHVYQQDIDYVYDEDLLDLVALPNGSLLNNDASIYFKYEQVLVPEEDYNSKPHFESLNERIKNNLVALNAIKIKNNTPISNVFRIYNETTGEIYNISRWNDDTIYFTYNTAPKVLTQTYERATFKEQNNEVLFVNSTLTNASLIKIYKVLLDNNNIISSTEDSIASSINTSLKFNNTSIFSVEKWFDRNDSEINNINRLTSIGDYCVDYYNGIVYCAVNNTQNQDLDFATYKTNVISPTYPHVITVNDIYYRVSLLNPKGNAFSYSSFDDGEINPLNMDYSDESYKFNDTTLPYQVYNNSVGVFSSTSFVAGVSTNIKQVNGLYELNDLKYNDTPFNFASATSFDSNYITLSSYSNSTYDSVKYDGSNYYVNIPEPFSYISPNLTFNINVIRQSDGYDLWNNSGTLVPASQLKLVLPGVYSPVVGDNVIINYSISVNNLSRVIVNYNRGEFYIDYSYLADEILVSYEYGDNVLDFRQSNTLSQGDKYYVSYKVGALRDALFKNFATLLNIPELSVFDTDLDRERYRDALMAGLESFIQGPTVSAIKNIATTISHIPAEVIESVFNTWSLGSSSLNPRSFETSGEFDLVKAKFGNGVLVNNNSQKITIPQNSNLKLESGTFQTWVAPEWNGIENDAELTFNIFKNNLLINSNKVYIGLSEVHPIFDGYSFKLKSSDLIEGVPNQNKDGVYIYFANDTSTNFKRWYVNVVDGYTDGYLYGSPIDYIVKIDTNGSFYDLKSITYPKPSNLTTTSTNKKLTFKIIGGVNANIGMTFISGVDKYLLDFGDNENTNRLSLYKDASGYLNFRIFDKYNNKYNLSADISSWKAKDLHHLAISWKLNTKTNRDEMHLFIDGFEVPNIIKYGNRLGPYLHEKYRTVNPEDIIGLLNRDIVGSNDLTTTYGSNQVSSSLNFSGYNVSIGDTLYIDGYGFADAGYTISNINGNTLTLGSVMPATITNGKFSINKTAYQVSSEISAYPNIYVSRVGQFLSGNDLSTSLNSAVVSSSSTNFTSANVEPGYLLHIDGYNDGYTFESVYTILAVSGTSLTINGNATNTYSNLNYIIYDGSQEQEIPGLRALNPSYEISQDGYFNSILTFTNNVYKKDLLLLRTLGLNSRKVKEKYYMWSNLQEHIIKSKLPAPISLDSVNIVKTIIQSTSIGPSNSTLILGKFNSNNITGNSCSNSQYGRTLKASISGTNVDFSSPVQVIITGQSGIYSITETLTFTDYGDQYSTNLFYNVDYINVICKPINSSKNCLNVEVKEKYSLTISEDSDSMFPKVKYSYQIGVGNTLFGDGYTATDYNHFFSQANVGNDLLITNPISAAGIYKITGVSADFHTVNLEPASGAYILPLPAFTDGYYQVLNVTDYRSGLQNGFFLIEQEFLPGQAYYFTKGWYELEYYSYLIVKMDYNPRNIFIGTDLNNQNNFNGVINQVKINDNMLIDTRVGESIPSNQRSITKDFNSIKPLTADANTLVLCSFDSFPFTNQADYYINYTDKKYIQLGDSVNQNFEKSLYVQNDHIILDNTGILDSKKEGSIEFWVSPTYDSANDPNIRYYFDASSAIVEDVVSLDYATLKLSRSASEIISVNLNNNPNVDYFAGGKIELATNNAVSETTTSVNSGKVLVSSPAFQIISVKIVGDLTNTDYFNDGTIAADKITIYLGTPLPENSLQVVITYVPIKVGIESPNTQIIKLNKRLPSNNTKVKVTYIPKGLQGDRLSIFKDKSGYLNFYVKASGIEYLIAAPTLWAKNTWHKIMATYKFNSGSDKLNLYVDGYQWQNVLFGTSLLYGQSVVFGSSYIGIDGLNASIKFKDPINELFVGNSYNKQNASYSAFDNIRISNIYRPGYYLYGEYIDINYTSNVSVVYPTTKDLYTTYLSNFEYSAVKNTDFAILKNKNTGIFDFQVNVFDSLDIINNNSRVKSILEALIKTLKPANSRVFINYE